jgi:glycosyltransferase involved in cell wall biosynthesis
VVHVITGLSAGGAENQLRLLLRHTVHDARVITLTNPGSVAAAIEAEGTRVDHLGMGGNRDVASLPRLRAMIRRPACDIAHVHLYRSCLYGRLAARLAGVRRVVTTEHSLGDGYIEGRRTTAGVRSLYLATERMSDATIAVSQAVRKHLIAWGVRSEKIVVVPNGVDFDSVAFDPVARSAARAELGLPTNAFVVGALGRLEAIKRFDVLLRAAAPLLGSNVRLLVVGDGAMRRELEHYAGQAKIQSHVVFTGERSSVGPLLSAMDLLVAPSASETFGLAVVEALGSGLPVLHAECPALDALPDRGAPKARRVAATERDLRQAIEAVMRTGGASDRAPVRSALERFGIQSCTRATDRVYDSLTEPAGSLA